MGTSYYISNVIQYLQGVCNLVDAIDSATKCRWDDVDRYLKIHPDHQYINLSSGKKHKGNKYYVVTTKQQYLGQDGSSILNERNGAMQFHTVEDAYAYIDNHSIPIKDFCVIDNKFKRYKRPVVFGQIQQHLADQPGRRIYLNGSTKKLVYEKTNCLKTLTLRLLLSSIKPCQISIRGSYPLPIPGRPLDANLGRFSIAGVCKSEAVYHIPRIRPAIQYHPSQ